MFRYLFERVPLRRRRRTVLELCVGFPTWGPYAYAGKHAGITGGFCRGNLTKLQHTETHAATRTTYNIRIPNVDPVFRLDMGARVSNKIRYQKLHCSCSTPSSPRNAKQAFKGPLIVGTHSTASGILTDNPRLVPCGQPPCCDPKQASSDLTGAMLHWNRAA